MIMIFSNFPVLIVVLLVAASQSSAQLSLRAISIRSTTIDVTWNPTAGSPNASTLYRVYVSNFPSSYCGIDVYLPETSISLRMTSAGILFKPRTSYSITVCSYWVDQRIDPTGEVLKDQDTITLETGPPAPDYLEVFDNQATQLSVRWIDYDASASHPVVNYRVFYGVQQTADSSLQQVTINNLQTNTEYHNIRIRSLTNDSIVSSDESATVAGITRPAKANSPTLIIPTTSSTIALEWEAVNEGPIARTYYVSWRAAGSVSSKTRTVSRTSHIIGHLQSNSAYEVTVAAGNVAGAGEASERVTFRTVPTKPNPPSFVSATSSSITLTWNRGAEGSNLQTHYIITWRRRGNGTSPLSRTTNRTSITIAGLESNSAYDFTVEKSSEAGNSGASDLEIYYTVPAKANSPYQLPSNSTSIGLQWLPVPEGSARRNYWVAWRLAGTQSREKSQTVSGTSTFITNLLSNTAYEVRIAPRNRAGYGNASNTVTFTTTGSNLAWIAAPVIGFILIVSLTFILVYYIKHRKKSSTSSSSDDDSRGSSNLDETDTKLASSAKKKGFSSSLLRFSFLRKSPGHDFTNEYQEDISDQGLLPGTEDDFWRLVWEQNCHYIAMLTQAVEKGRVKSDRYWPYDNDVTLVGGFSLQMVRETISPLWTEREFLLRKGAESRYVTQYSYTAWPRHGVPEITADLMRLGREILRKIDTENRPGPILVHCSTSVGQTGSKFIPRDELLQGFNERTYVDMFGMVEGRRRSRSNMVQTENQDEFIHPMVVDLPAVKFEISPDDENEG